VDQDEASGIATTFTVAVPAAARDSFVQSNVYYFPAIIMHEIRDSLGHKRFFAVTRSPA
jgi:hypothetical protein